MNFIQPPIIHQTLPFGKLRASLLILASLLISLATSAQDYTYDALNRLTTVTTLDGHQQIYHYDAAGNLLSITTVCCMPCMTTVGATVNSLPSIPTKILKSNSWESYIVTTILKP